MPRFTKEDVLDELRTIFLFEADHILLGAGPESAEQFIGFRVPEDGEYCFQSLRNVDLSRFSISGSFDRGYDFAFRPSLLNALGEEEVQDLTVFMLGTPRAGGIGSGGETHRFMTPHGYCQTVADAVHARWKLEWHPDEAGSYEFTPRELALLANMTEGAVRNAIGAGGESGLTAIPGTKNPILISHDEAWRWLKQRRGFIPFPQKPSDDRFLGEHVRSLDSAESLARFVARRLQSVFGSPERAPSTLGWPSEEVERWLDGSFEFDSERSVELARALGLDPPLFVGKALEVSMRRDRVAIASNELQRR